MNIIEILLGCLLVGVFIAVLFLASKKENEKLNARISTLSEEQKKRIMNALPVSASDKNGIWRQEGMIYEAKERGNSMALYVLWYNRLTREEGEERIENADLKMNKNDYESHGLKTGDFIMMEMDLQKGKASVVFE